MPRAWILACNRSGSTVLLEILRRLCADIPASDAHAESTPTPAPFQQEVARLCDALGPVDFHSTGVTHFGTIDFIASRGRDFAFLTRLPVARHDHDTVHLCYATPTAETVDRLHNAPRFAPVRHPLDIIVSHAFEYEHVLLAMHGEAVVDADYRELYGRTRLASDEWIHHAGQYVGNFYAELTARGRALTPVRYEELISEPTGTIQGIAQAADLSCSPADAEAMWSAIGFRPLRKNSAHLFRPGTGKWREYIDRPHLAVLEAIGLQHLTRELGYEWPDDVKRSLSTPAPPASVEAAVRLAFDLAVGDAMNERMFGTEVAFDDGAVQRIEGPDGVRAVVTPAFSDALQLT